MLNQSNVISIFQSVGASSHFHQGFYEDRRDYIYHPFILITLDES